MDPTDEDRTVLRPGTPRLPPDEDATILRPSTDRTKTERQPPAPTTDWMTRAPAGAMTRDLPRYQAPVEVIEAPASGPDWRRIAALFLATAVVAVLAGFGYVRFVHRQKVDPSTQVSVSQTAVGPQFTRADDMVRSYLQAVAAGDTVVARDLGDMGSGDAAAISPEAYARSLATHPLTAIQVSASGDNPSSVRARYLIGDQEVDTRVRVVRTANGSWRLARSTVEIALTNRSAPSLPVRLNEATISSGVAELLPGHYVVSSGLPFIDYPADNSLTITNLEYEGRVERELTPMITPAGRQALVAAAQESLDACLQARTLTPEGCPNRLEAGAAYLPETVRWSLVNDPFATAPPALDSTDPTRGQVSVLLKFGVSFTYADGSTNGEQTLDTLSASVSASLLVNDPGQIEVLWR